MSISEAADIFITNLSEIGLESEDDYISSEEDETGTNSNLSNFMSLNKEMSILDSSIDFNTKRDSVFNSSTISVYQNHTKSDCDFPDNHSTPLSSHSFNSIENLYNLTDKPCDTTLLNLNQDDILDELDRTLNDDKGEGLNEKYLKSLENGSSNQNKKSIVMRSSSAVVHRYNQFLD